MKRQVLKFHIPVALNQIWESNKIISNNNSVDFFKQLEVQTLHNKQMQKQNFNHVIQLVKANTKKMQKLQGDITYLSDCCQITFQNINILQLNANGILKVLK
ncbi:Hypothetical_protein [Hexamita inflata]|uniref:Hypothetical_protein n=1 Tax=Hexamita inflata TaxID=28002 RepID=A0AA86UFW7_9EUKA|nr:Hypothetical protein HINF_LOCUS44220 [Hexamita inflata]